MALQLVAQVEAHVEGHLVVAGAGGVQLAADRADALDEPRLDVHVDVFEADLELEVAGLDVGEDRLQPGDDLVCASASAMIPCLASIRQWAMEPWMS